MIKKREIVILSAGKTASKNLYPFFKINTKNQFITNYRKSIFSNFSKINEVLGYKKKKIFKKSNVFHNKLWKNEKAFGSLIKFIKKRKPKDLYICYSDIIFNEDSLQNLFNTKKDVSFYLNILKKDNKKIKEKFKIKNKNYEFSGLLYLKNNVIEFLYHNYDYFYNNYKTENLSKIVSILIKKFNFEFFCDENVKECFDYKDYLNFLFFSKGHALKNLRYKNIIINKFYNFTFQEWKNNQKEITKIIKKKLNKDLIVRSSSNTEDKFDYSNAGKYLSIPFIKNNNLSLTNAINKVFKSYNNKNPNQFIIVQNMQTNFDSSGVIFSRDIEKSSKYFIIKDIDKKYGDTSFVTAGKSLKEKKIIVYSKSKDFNQRYKNLIKYIKFVQNITGLNALDCEYALYRNKTIIFQIRPLNIRNKILKREELKIEKNIENTFKKLKVKYEKDKKKLSLSVMTDWNPAEIIGKESDPLSIFLYEYLILNKNWYTQRLQNGYSKFRNIKLSYQIGNTLYIDVIKSFKSFIPEKLNYKTKNKILNYYLLKLNKNPDLHDKIETEIVFSNLSKKTHLNLIPLKLNTTEKNIFLVELKKVNEEIKKKCFLHYETLNKLNLISKNLFKNLKNSKNLNDSYKVLNLTRKKFILPFAHLARGGFVSKFILKDFFKEKKMNEIISQIDTISTNYRNDIKILNQKDFQRKYMHLVPNTYDFTNLIEKNNISNLKLSNNYIPYKKIEKKELKFHINDHQIKKLGFNSLKDFKNFLSITISGREYAKYIFSRNIYLFFLILRNWAISKKIDLYKIKFIDKKIYNHLRSKKNYFYNFAKEVKKNEDIMNLQKKINLPDFINHPNNIYNFSELISKPSFIGNKCKAKLICFNKNIKDNLIYKNKIVLIPNADPGFEFLFHLGIKGIITKYGGSNSHMAIRSYELNLTSIIGVGEKYEVIKNFSGIKIDPENKRFKVI